MFLSKKSKGYCVDFGEQSTMVVRLSQFESPLIVEGMQEFPVADPGQLSSWASGAEGRGPTGYVHSYCGIYPQRRVVRRQTLDLKRARDPGYFNEIYSQQFRVEADKYTILALNSESGSEYDPKANQKEVLFCGMPSEEIISTQSSLLEQGIYPERLELGTVATLGGLVSYLKWKQSRTPILFLEMGAESTHSFILSADGVDISRPIPSGTSGMIPVIQKELGLKDEESAKKLFYSNTFDFTSMGGTLIKKLLKELQSSIGFYEVQTGQSIGHVFCTQLPRTLDWIGTAIASSLGVTAFSMELAPWLDSIGIKIADGASPASLDEKWLGVFALVASYKNGIADTTPVEKG